MGFGGPLVIFAVAPEEDYCSEDGAEHEGKPSAMGDFSECGRKVEAVYEAEEEEAGEDNEGVEFPDD